MNIIPKLYKLSYTFPSLLQPRSLPSPISLFSTTKPLSSTQFSKQLGLQTQLQKFIKQQQKHQKSTYRSSAIIVIGLLTAVGTYAVVQLVDSQLQLIRLYKVTRGYLKLKYLGKEKKEQVLRQLEERYINSLYQYYQKNYKDRSYVDVWFVRKLIGLITESSQVNNDLIFNLVTLMTDKLQSTTRSASVILELVQTMVYKNKTLPQNQALLINLCTSLLKWGNLNQQYLGLVTLSKTNLITKLNQLLTITDIHQTIHTLQANKTKIQHQLKPISSTQSHEPSQLQIKIITVKQKLLYQINELKLSHQIKINKVNCIGEFLQEVTKRK